MQKNIFKKSLLHGDGKEETLQERNFKLYHDINTMSDINTIQVTKKRQKKKKEVRKKRHSFTNYPCKGTGYKTKKSQFYFLFGYGLEKLKE